jgi:hypothetical protein
MMSKRLSLAAAVVAASLLAASAAFAQSSQDSSKPSPYQGVSTPPPDDTILTTDDTPPPPPAAKPAPAASQAAPAPAKPEPVATTAPAPSDAVVADTDNDVELSRRPADSSRRSGKYLSGDDGIVTYIPGPANALPEGTTFRVTMQQEIFGDNTMPGTPFRARLTQDLKYEGRVVVPAGSELRGKVLYAYTSRRISGQSTVHLRPDEFVLPNGTRYSLHALAIDTDGSNTKVSGEGNIVPKAHGKRTLVELAATSGGGAVVGAALGGPAGAAVGSAVGAGITGARWFLDTQSVDIPENSTVVFSLTDPMFLTPAKD